MARIDPLPRRLCRRLLATAGVPLCLLAGGCASGSSASLTMAPLFFAESADAAGNILPESGSPAGATASSLPAGIALASAEMPRFILAGGNASLPLTVPGDAGGLAASAALGATSLTPGLVASLGAALSPGQTLGILPGGALAAGVTVAGAPVVAASAEVGAQTSVNVAALPTVLPVQANVSAGAGGVSVDTAIGGVTVAAALPAPATLGAVLTPVVAPVASGVAAITASAAVPIASIAAPVVAPATVLAAPVVAPVASIAAPISVPIAAAAAPVTAVAAPLVAPVAALASPVVAPVAAIVAPLAAAVAPVAGGGGATLLANPLGLLGGAR